MKYLLSFIAIVTLTSCSDPRYAYYLGCVTGVKHANAMSSTPIFNYEVRKQFRFCKQMSFGGPLK